MKRLLKDVLREDYLNIFSSQVKLSLEFTNSLSQFTNNHTSASLLSVARTGLSFFFFFSSRIVDATMIISLAHEQFFLFGDVQKALEKKKKRKVDVRTPQGLQRALCSSLKSKFFSLPFLDSYDGLRRKGGTACNR